MAFPRPQVRDAPHAVFHLTEYADDASLRTPLLSTNNETRLDRSAGSIGVEIGASPRGPGVCGPAYVGACAVLGLSAGLDDDSGSHARRTGLLPKQGARPMLRVRPPAV